MSLTRGLLALIVALLLPALLVGGGDDTAKETKKLGKRLQRAIALNADDKIEGLLDQLAAIKSPEAIELIVTTTTAETSEAIFQKSFDLLSGMSPADLDPCFVSLLEAKKLRPLMLAVVIMVAEKIEGEIAEGWMLKALKCGDDVAQRNAILALDLRRSKRAIPELIDLLEEGKGEAGTIQYMTRIALISLTGHDFELIEDWRNSWDAHKTSIDPKNLGETEGDSGVALKRVGKDTPEFFGVKIVSRKVIFVIDVSGSMVLWDDDGSGDWQSRQRLLRVKKELTKAVHGLKKKSYFNILAYSTEVQPLMKQLGPTTKGNKGKALKFIKKLNARGGTLTDDALRAAFRDPNADTIVLLSDGSPARSKDEGPEVMIPRILDEARKLNRLRKVRVFTFGFEGKGEFPPGDQRKLVHEHKPEEMIRFLKTLAEDHGGEYTTVK